METAHGINAGTGASRCKTCPTADSSHTFADADRGYAAIVPSGTSTAGFG